MNAGTAVALNNAAKEVQQARKEVQQTRPYPGSDLFTLLLILKNLETVIAKAQASCAEAEL